MMTMNFFNGIVTVLKENKLDNSELREWARIEYKDDANFAYDYYLQTGKLPTVGVKQ